MLKNNNTMKKLITLIILASSLCASRAEDNWILSLSGNGNTTLGSGGETLVGADVAVGHTGKILLPVEAGLRQGFGYASQSDTAIFDTKVYFDVLPLKFSRFEAGLGLNVGATYGNTPIVYSASPEAIVRFWLTEKAGIFGRVEYPFDLGDNELGDRILYSLGLVVRF